MLREKIITLNHNSRKKEGYLVNNMNFHHKNLEERVNWTSNKQKEETKGEINKKKNETQRDNQTKLEK